jgi:hypothetical protein
VKLKRPVPLPEIAGAVFHLRQGAQTVLGSRPSDVREPASFLGTATLIAITSGRVEEYISTTMRYAHSDNDTKARAVARLPSGKKIVTTVPRKAKKPKVAH